MQINSAYFIFLFLPLFLLLFLLMKKEVRTLYLIISSLVFYYLGEGRLVVLLMVIIVVNHTLARWIQRNPATPGSRIPLFLGLLFNVGILVYYKYTLFLLENLLPILNTDPAGPVRYPRIVLPAGISFISFHGVSFLVDVYRKKVKGPVQWRQTGLYLSFFPKLITGPISRYADFASQRDHPDICAAKIMSGIRRFVIGLAKKVILADSLNRMTGQIFAVPAGEHTGAMAWLGIIGYTLQIYYDFSGYTDMAIGLSRICGYQLPENFNFPYISRSIKDFWRRWHISLARWLQEYLFLPVAYRVMRQMSPRKYSVRRASNAGYYVGAMITMSICGIWHGAHWTFLWWGVYYGIFLVVEHAGWGKILRKTPRVLQTGYALLVIMVSWVIFRSESMAYALSYLKSMIGIGGAGEVYYASLYYNREIIFLLVIGILGSLPVSRFLESRFEGFRFTRRWYPLATYLYSFCLLLLSTSYLVNGGYNPFIYFRF